MATREEIYTALRNADAAGDTESVRKLGAYLQTMNAAPAPLPQEIPGPVESAFIAGGQGLDKLAAGLRAATPAPVRNGLDWLNNKLGMGQPPSIDPAVQAQNDATMKPVHAAYPLTTGLAEALPSMAGGIPGMMALAGLSYGTPTEKALNVAGAGLGGALGAGAGKLAARVAQPIQGASADAAAKVRELFSRNGMTPLASQETGSVPLGWMESTLANLPGGAPIRAAVKDQRAGLNAAALREMGGSGDSFTPEAVKNTMRAVGSKFDTIPAGQTVALDGTLADKLSAVEADYMKNLSADQKGIVASHLDDIRNAGESIPGDVYQKWRSRISARANSTGDSELKGALTGIYKALDDAFNRSATGNAAADYATARGQYTAGKKLQGLSDIGGNVSPARLATAAKDIPGDLPQLAFSMKGLPDSGTAQRKFYQDLLTGGGMGGLGAGAGYLEGGPEGAAKGAALGAVGSFALPYAASKALANPAFRDYLTRGLIKMTPELERELMLSGQLGGGLLGQRLGR